MGARNTDAGGCETGGISGIGGGRPPIPVVQVKDGPQPLSAPPEGVLVLRAFVLPIV